MADTVFLPALLVAVGAEGALFAQAGGRQAIGGDAEGDEVVFHGGGAAVTEDEVVFGGTAFVAVAFDGGADFRMVAQELGGLSESFASIGADVGFVEIEVGVFNVSKEQCTNVISHGLWRWRGWRRSDGDADAGVSRAAGTAGGNCVGRGSGGGYFGGALGGDGADVGSDGELGGVGGRPAESCRAAPFDGGGASLD